VWETVRDKFFDPHFNGVDWNKTHERYSPQVASVKTDVELYRTITRMLGELRVSHMEIIPPDVIAQFNSPPVTTGLGLRSVEGQVVVLRVLPSAERMGVRPGFVITSVDGEHVKDLDDALARLHGPADSRVRVGCLDEHDQARELSLDRSLLGSDEVERQKFGQLSVYALLEARRLDDGIGYIRFTSFIATLEKKLSAAVDSMRNAPGLIIDLRGNGAVTTAWRHVGEPSLRQADPN
jgi:C-terminal processing protease CtpA/Prc